MAEDVAKLIVGLDSRNVAVYSARHESGAIGMADGYSRSTGRVGVAVVGRGPGLTNGMNALITAARAGSRVLVLTGASPVLAAGTHRNPKHLDQAALLDAVRVRNVLLESPARAIADFEASFELSRRGFTVVVNVPEDVAEAEAGALPNRSDVEAEAGR